MNKSETNKSNRKEIMKHRKRHETFHFFPFYITFFYFIFLNPFSYQVLFWRTFSELCSSLYVYYIHVYAQKESAVSFRVLLLSIVYFFFKVISLLVMIFAFCCCCCLFSRRWNEIANKRNKSQREMKNNSWNTARRKQKKTNS